MKNIKKGPGAPKGRRPVMWVCEAIVGCTCGNAKLKSEKILVEDQSPDSAFGNFPVEVAENTFKDKYGIKPVNMFGPLYEKKSGQQIKSKTKKTSISRDISDIKFCMNRKQKNAIWGDWHGIASFLEGDSENVYFAFVKEVNPKIGKERKTPLPGKVLISDLKFQND